MFDTFFPHCSTSINFCIEVHFSKNHTSYWASHRTITNRVIHYVKIVKNFFFNPFEYFFTSILFYWVLFSIFANRIIVDSNVTIEVHSEKVIECTKSFSFSNTCFSSIAILRLIVALKFFDVIKDSITFCYTTISERPTVVNVTSIFFPSVFVHSLRHTIIEPVSTTSRNNYLIRSIFLHTPITFTINITILTSKLRIGIGNQSRKLFWCFKIIFFQNISINFRFKVGTSSVETHTCRHNSDK